MVSNMANRMANKTVYKTANKTINKTNSLQLRLSIDAYLFSWSCGERPLCE